MPATAIREARGAATFETLTDATRGFRLEDPTITNRQITERLPLTMGSGDYGGSPCCIFYWESYPAMIRTKENEVLIFHLYAATLNMEAIGAVPIRLF